MLSPPSTLQTTLTFLLMSPHVKTAGVPSYTSNLFLQLLKVIPVRKVSEKDPHQYERGREREREKERNKVQLELSDFLNQDDIKHIEFYTEPSSKVAGQN